MYRITPRQRRASTAPPPSARMRARRTVVGVAVAALALSAAGLLSAGAASAASTTVTDASFSWGLSGEQGGGAFFGGCNFLSAGTAGNTGSSRLWTQTDGFYATQSGNVTVEKPNAAGVYSQPTWATKCQDPSGTAVSSSSTTSLTKNRVKFSQGTGTVDTAANTAAIHWTGSFTSAFYGGLTYWSATDPTLVVNADGSATLTATASGYGADMNDPAKWVALTPTTITLAKLHGVTVTGSGFTVIPDYLGVAVTVPSGASPQAAQSTANAPYWGSFPQSFVDFQQLTGQSSYWFSSGGSRDAAKPAVALAVGYTANTGPAQVAPAITTQPADTSVQVGGTAVFCAAASGTPDPTVQWQLQAPGSSAWQNYPSATAGTFNLNVPAQGYHGSKVRAVFTNAAGVATTDPVTLSVTAAPPASDSSETITATVPAAAGQFSWTIDGTDHAVRLTNTTNKGSYLQSTGDLKPVTVTDTRAAGPAWSVSGQVGDFTGGLAGKYLGWTPALTTAGGGASAGAAVAAGITAGNGLTDASTLALAPTGHATGSVNVGAGLDLRVPANTPAGTYTATLTLTALS